MSMLPSPSSVLSAYASMSTSIMLFRTMLNELCPVQLQNHIINVVRFYWKPKTKMLTLVVDEKDGLVVNQIFVAVESYLCTRISPDSDRLRMTKSAKEHHINIKFADIGVIADSFEGIPVTWTYVREESKQKSDGSSSIVNGYGSATEKKHIELTFDKKYKEVIVSRYVPSVIKKSQQLEMEKKVVKLFSLQLNEYAHNGMGDSVNLDHPSTFDTLAMDPEMKKEIIDDLDLFLSRKDFYKKVGKVWKRGYLLYGPPGTGKSSLIAAIANYLKFNVYDLQLKNVRSDSCLRELLLKTSNRSILVIEDIDCSVKLPDRNEDIYDDYPQYSSSRDPKISLSGLLNFIDGLWSSCGDERIIIFTTNHKEKLDPALLRPGRMDKHIHMSYLTVEGFKILATNYLNMPNVSDLRFKEIYELIKCSKVTPAEVAEELMVSDNVEVVLQGLVKFLKRKKVEEDEVDDRDDEAKKARIM